MRTFILGMLLLPVLAFAKDMGEWTFVQQLPGFFINTGCHDSTDCWTFNHTNVDHYLYKSSDQGRSWYEVYHLNAWDTEDPKLFNPRIALSPDTDHYYISFRTDRGDILKSTDGGETYKRISIDIDHSVRPQMQDCNTGYIGLIDSLVEIEEAPYSVAYGSMLVTFDGWETYEHREIPPPHNTRGMEIIDTLSDGTSRMLENQRFILHYNFYSDTWAEIGASEEQLYTFEFVNKSLGYGADKQRTGVGDTGYDRIFRTTDGGKSFEKMVDTLIEGNPWGLQDISFYDEINGVAVGAWGKVWMTNNGGKKWHCWKCESTPDVFIREGDEIYGPPVLDVMWAGRTPVIATRFGGNMYRYEGSFFKFDGAAPDLYPPDGVSPANSSIAHETDIEFQWSVAEAEKYLFRLSEYPDLTNAVADESTVEPKFTVENLKRYTDYYWSVASVLGGEEHWSPVYTFRTKMADVEPLSPACGSEDQPRDMTIKWEAVTGAEQYRFRMSEDELFTEIYAEDDYLTTNSIDITDLEYSTTYYWQVAAYNSKEITNWSDVCSFTVKNPASVPESASQFRIYPNPANSTLYVDGIENNYGLEYQISDLNGKIRLSGTLTDTGINIKSLSTGVYYINIEINEAIYKDKFVKK